MKTFGLTDKGAVRADNQDCYIIEKCRESDCAIVALCDGMGGAKAGGIASRLSARAFVDHVYGKVNRPGVRASSCVKILEDACKEANGVSFEYSHIDIAYDGMGTTLVGGVVFNNGKAVLINVGDSRAYVISKRKANIKQITRDHSMVGDLLAFGAITEEQAKTHPQKNVITRALGTDAEVQCDSFSFDLSRSEVLLLCSDGLSNMVENEEILAIATENPDPENICRELMHTAMMRGATDNVTVVALMR